MLRFVQSDSSGLPLKRKQSSRACDKCRRNKKRCVHFPTEGEDVLRDVGGRELSSDAIYQGRVRPTQSIHESNNTALQNVPDSSNAERIPNESPYSSSVINGNTQHAIMSDENGDSSRFVGDLNPEAIFLSTASPEEPGGPIDDKVGVWVPRSTLRQVGNSIGSALLGSPHSTGSGVSSLLPRVILPSIEDQFLRVIPSQADFDALKVIYLEEFHPIFPIVDINTFDGLQPESPSKTVLKQTICLAASSNVRSGGHLRLPSTSNRFSLLPAKTFAEQLVQALRMIINMDLIKDKLILIQVLAVLSLCTQFSDDRHSSAELNSRAVSHAQTVGLHLDTSATREDHVYVTRLFYCTWVLDKLNAAFHGRPTIMHERDIGRDLRAGVEEQDGPFQLLLRIVLLLDGVIAIYRPFGDSTVNSLEKFPSFEELLDQSAISRAPAHLLATIETLYHATAMLSYRSRSSEQPSWSSNTHLRQALSAMSVTSIVGDEFSGQLSLFPFVPYAVTLALRVSYITLRLSKSQYMRIRARRKVLKICAMLREFGDIFATSTHMAELAEQTINEMDKVYVSMATQRRASIVPPTQAVSTSENMNGRVDDHAPTEDPSTMSRPNALLHDENALHAMHQQLHQDPYNPMFLDTMPDMNVFEHFDPDFDLDAIDAALANGFDPYWSNILIEPTRPTNR